jgi:hypothetical protein
MISRTQQIVEAAAAGLDPPDCHFEEGLNTKHPNAATPAPPAPKLPERLPLASSPRAKLEAHRATARHLAALVGASDSMLSEFDRRQISPRSVVDHFEQQQIKVDHSGELDKARAAIAAAQEDARREREGSRELRQDLDAARRVLTSLEDYVSKYGIRDGDPAKQVRVKVILGQLCGGGKTTKNGETTELSEPEVLSLARRGFVEILEK